MYIKRLKTKNSKMKTEIIYQEILKARPHIKEFAWQKEYLTDLKVFTEPKVVLGAGTSSGKTLATVMMLEIFYLNPANKGKRTLILPASQSVLKSNFIETLEFFMPSFSYCAVKGAKEFNEAVNSDCDVIIALPQTLKSIVKTLPHFHNFILDEAHEWYFSRGLTSEGSTIKKALKSIKPNHQYLLSGTPFEFTLKKKDFYIKYVPVMDLYKDGLITNVQIEIVSSSYKFDREDYGVKEDLRDESLQRELSKTNDSLNKVLVEAIKKLKNPIKGLHNVNRITKNTASLFFNHIGKTVVFARSIEQCDILAMSFRKKLGEDKVLVSHSKLDPKSENMDEFKKEECKAKILVVVNRGRLGWSYKELFNIIDFTMTRNLSVNLQMLARLFRISEKKPKDQKIYYKVANSLHAPYYVKVMESVLVLLGKEWYSKYNGKNMMEIELPRVVQPKTPSEPSDNPKKQKRERTYNLYDMGVTLDLNFFNNHIFNKNSDYYSTIAMTNLEIVRDQLLYGGNRNTVESAKEIALQYQHKTTFGYDHPNLATWIVNMGLAEECFGHMPDYQCQSRMNDKTFIRDFFRKHKGLSKQEFSNIPGPAEQFGDVRFRGKWYWLRAKKLGISNECEKIMGWKKREKQSLERALKVASTFECNNQMQLAGYTGLIQWCYKHGYKEEITKAFKGYKTKNN